jgi:heterodisulfide reductase subunit A-like polyferredoxin
MTISRRGFLSFGLFSAPEPSPPVVPPVAPVAAPPVAPVAAPPVASPATPVLKGVVPQINTRQCLAWTGQSCTVCRDVCPIPHAIRLVAMMPRINDARCDGCGLCVSKCPIPTLAFKSGENV